MTIGHPFPRPAALLIILVMAGVSALGFYSIRKDVENLGVNSQDNILWSATQMEIELLRLQRSLAFFRSEPDEGALADVHVRLDIVWSRLGLVTEGRVGEILRRHDQELGTLGSLADYLSEVDPVLLELSPEDTGAIPDILRELEVFQSELRLYTLDVARGDTAEASQVRERILVSSQLTATIVLVALGISLVSLFLFMRDNARQREMADLNLRQAEAAEAASQAKSRFLTMMSHELRNPLNGILGPLALLGQSERGERQVRLIERAQQAGRTMLRMLRGLLEYGDIEDRKLVLKREALRLSTLAEEVRTALDDVSTAGRARIEVTVADDAPELIWGDPDRIAQIFVYLGEYMLAPSGTADVRLALFHDGKNLIGDIAFDEAGDKIDWKLDLLIGMSKEVDTAFSSDVLGPLIVRGLLNAAQGVLTLAEDGAGRRVVRVLIPARSIVFDKIRVHLETRSTALETLYRAALRSERVAFLPPESPAAADLVLVDSTSVGEPSLMVRLRARFPDALFVSLGLPASPSYFDEVVEAPHDMVRLRRSVLGRLAS